VPLLPEFDARMTVRLPYELRKGLEEVATAHGGTASDALRLAAELIVDAHRSVSTPDPQSAP
jgi:acetolactate synthase regulatory subunit